MEQKNIWKQLKNMELQNGIVNHLNLVINIKLLIKILLKK